MKLQCDSCRRPACATEQMHKGVAIVICDECAKSEFRIDRCIERAMERMTGWGRAAK